MQEMADTDAVKQEIAQPVVVSTSTELEISGNK